MGVPNDLRPAFEGRNLPFVVVMEDARRDGLLQAAKAIRVARGLHRLARRSSCACAGASF